MHIVSIQVGQPREVASEDGAVRTAIFKQPVVGRVQLRQHNLDGDKQGDPRVHGGPDKAVYVYPVEHYDYWRARLPGTNLPPGAFGENLTISGLREDEVHVGDRFRIGEAEVRVTEPRIPCVKLGIRLSRPDIIKPFLASRRTGWYLGVTREGEIGAGDAIERLSTNPEAITIKEIVALYASKRPDPDLLRRAVATKGLPARWHDRFQHRLDHLTPR